MTWMNCTVRPVTAILSQSGMRAERLKCCTKEGLIEEDEKPDAGNQLENRGGGGEDRRRLWENLETEGRDKRSGLKEVGYLQRHDFRLYWQTHANAHVH